jgi:hypothetical protein
VHEPGVRDEPGYRPPARKAAELTQKEIAAAMGRDQSSVSRMEARSDMLLSTLAECGERGLLGCEAATADAAPSAPAVAAGADRWRSTTSRGPG